MILIIYRYGHVILHQSPLIVFLSSHWSVPFPPCSFALALHRDPFDFSQMEKSFKPKFSLEKLKGSC